jgi:hypothetical protein
MIQQIRSIHTIVRETIVQWFASSIPARQTPGTTPMETEILSHDGQMSSFKGRKDFQSAFFQVAGVSDLLQNAGNIQIQSPMITANNVTPASGMRRMKDMKE